MEMNITWYGHSNVLIEQAGVKVLIDPFFEGNPYAPKWETIPAPNIIAITHDHGDHLGQSVELAKKYGSKLACIVELATWFREQGIPAEQILNYGTGWNIGGTVVEQGVSFTMIQAFHTAAHGFPVGFIIRMPDNMLVYHAGDTGLFSDMQLIKDYRIDVAMLPIGGVFTMDAEQAVKAAMLINPNYVMPIHYATFPVLAKTSDEFVRLLSYETRCIEPILPTIGQTYRVEKIQA